MISFPNAKINLGLNILSRRPDGYHNLDMVMVPVGWCDILEIVPAKGPSTTLSVSGRQVCCPMEKNLVYKAWLRLNEAVSGNLPPVDIFLHKVIPDGAGLGGGSADASFTLKMLDSMFSLGLGDTRLSEIAASIGADCPFFIYNRPMLCTGIGTDMSPVEVDFGTATNIVIAKPEGIGVSTAEAYSGVKPDASAQSSLSIISSSSPELWRDRLRNGFEDHVFTMKPKIAEIKHAMYSAGAVYASMSGSGSAVFGIFNDAKMAERASATMSACDCYVGTLPYLMA